ncbi:glycosyltransferase family 2 protein [Neptunitalea lumnitzerae]|uniref:Dolichol-phosphate mannosyltransferase n=1 Tax=Neptunitalea lumnitzerae TaxID=2965509 RepID=A0ABQ5MHU4_9FLAO|nr:glycosyltransferase family 2 protein [Neptunitalea sp. Y10]GLB48963.1 dolichol-phosphate mannosyltransferase [Neptunitalea sp. Y10]
MVYEFTIVVPLYNEEENLLRLEEALNSFLTMASKQSAVLFVNDGSTDNSQQLIETICARNTHFSFLEFEKNQGLSAAIKAGFDHVETKYVGYIDADLQTSPQDFNLLLAHAHEHDLVTGIRTNRQDTPLKKLSSKIANTTRRTFTKDGIDDTGCPLKVFKTSSAKTIPMFKGTHRFFPAMIQLQKGTVLQIPVQHFPRIAGTPKFGIWNRLVGPLLDCFIFLWMKKRYINYKIKRDE